MKIKNLILLLLVFTSNIILAQEKELEFTVNLLANDKISEVNINNDAFISSIGKLIDYCKTEFKTYPKTQKIGIYLITHKSASVTFKIFSDPDISPEISKKILNDLNSISIENTKIVDFPIFISINSKNEGEITDFKDFVDPEKQKFLDYKNGDLGAKLALNKDYAINEALPVLAAYQTIVDDKFAGVKNFGNLISKTNFNQILDIDKLTSNNKNYWRGYMEMESGNLLIPITKIFTFISQGEFDYAVKYIEVLNNFSKDNIPKIYLNNLNYRLMLFNETLNNEIQKGISFHDKGEFDKAISIYDEILRIYPNSSWALYEKYYSKNAKDLSENKIKIGDRKDWDTSKVDIYKHNPLYNMDIRASNGVEGYLLFRRMEIKELFKNKENYLKDIFTYAKIARDLKVYDFSAHLFWLSYTYDSKNQKEALNNYLYCIDKLGEKELKANFKGDFEKIFKKIDDEMQNEMKTSEIYKSFDK